MLGKSEDCPLCTGLALDLTHRHYVLFCARRSGRKTELQRNGSQACKGLDLTGPIAVWLEVKGVSGWLRRPGVRGVARA